MRYNGNALPRLAALALGMGACPGFLFFLTPPAQAEVDMYYTSNPYVTGGDVRWRVMPNGPENILFSQTWNSNEYPEHIRVAGDTVYWNREDPTGSMDLKWQLWSCGKQGQNPTMLVDLSGTNAPWGDIQVFGDQIYWADRGGGISRCDLAGHNIQTVVTGNGSNPVWNLAIYNNRFYWTRYDYSTVLSTAALDGSDYHDIPLKDTLRALWLQVCGGDLIIGDQMQYNQNPIRILKYSWDGQTYQNLNNTGTAFRLCDSMDGRLYYEDIPVMYGPHNLVSMDLNGGNVTILRTDAQNMTYWDITPEPATLSLLAVGGMAALLRRRRAQREE